MKKETYGQKRQREEKERILGEILSVIDDNISKLSQKDIDGIRARLPGRERSTSVDQRSRAAKRNNPISEIKPDGPARPGAGPAEGAKNAVEQLQLETEWYTKFKEQVPRMSTNLFNLILMAFTDECERRNRISRQEALQGALNEPEIPFPETV